jgi:hypothetical protein
MNTCSDCIRTLLLQDATNFILPATTFSVEKHSIDIRMMMQPLHMYLARVGLWAGGCAIRCFNSSTLNEIREHKWSSLKPAYLPDFTAM